MVNDDDTVIASQVDLKMSAVKLLNANWAINTHNLIPQRPELIRSDFRKVGLLLTLLIMYLPDCLFILHVFGLLHPIPFFISV